MVDVVKSVRTGGTGDYTSWVDWDADLDEGAIYSSGDRAIGEGYHDAAFDEYANITGGTTVGLSQVIMQAADGEMHPGS